MSTRYPHVVRAVFDTPWLIRESAFDAIVEVLERRLEGGRLTEAEIADRLAIGRQEAGPRSSSRRAGAVAVIPVYGILAQRASYFEDTSTGGTSVQSLQRAFREALADPEVASILFDVDSPGGHVSGIPEFAEEIRAARGQKPMVTVSNTLMASAALWLGLQADEVVVTPSSLTGSVGVVMGHVDFTKQEEMLGIKTTLVHYGEHKVEMYDSVQLSEDARAHMQRIVDATGRRFDKALAVARGKTPAQIHAEYGQGRVHTPEDAVALGIADRIDTFEGALQRLAAGKVVSRGAKAIAEVHPRATGVAALDEMFGLPFAERLARKSDLLAAGKVTVNQVRVSEGLEPLPDEAPPDGDTPVDPDHDEGEDLEEATEPEAIARADIEIAKAKAAANSRR